jgi:flagellar basal-body rod modification protein FlgD
MSVSSSSVGTNSSGQTIQGTSGSSIGNSSADNISTNEFLDLMLTSLQNQNPLDPSSQDPTQYLTELAQMTAVEQETDTSQNTSASAQTQSVSQAIGTTGDPVTGTVNSVQITSSGPTLTVAGVAGVDLSTITNVTAASSSGTAIADTSGSSAGSSSTASGS